MEHEPGDTYIRRFATFIRSNEKGLAQAAIVRHRKQPQPAPSDSSSFLTFFSSAQAKPVVLSISTHHLFYLLIRLEALGINIGSLDVRVQSPSRPMSYVNIFQDSDKSDTLSLSSIRSSLSVVSSLSLGAGWWKSQERPIDDDLKFIYSSFTKIPALSITPPSRKMIQELANDPPNQNALPLDAFKNLQFLEITEVDPRTFLGWDRLADSLVTLKIRSSGVQDFTEVFIHAVLADQARREGVKPGQARRRQAGQTATRRTSVFQPSDIPELVPEDGDAPPTAPPTESREVDDARSAALPSSKWSQLRSLSLPANELTFFPSALLPLPPEPSIFSSLTALDLSSNLLVSVPPSLSSLIYLRSLNLSDNMIDSVLHIYQNVGSIQSINLSKNRLISICGLERLMALEVVDLRDNYIEESSEIGRLATLPNIRQVWIETNPLTELEDDYRIVCFDLFLREGKEVLLDGSAPGLIERRGLATRPSPQMTSSRPMSIAPPSSPPTVAVAHKSTSPPLVPQDAAGSSRSPSGTPQTSPQIQAVSSKPKKKKAKRIVDLDGNESDASTRSHKRKHARRHSIVSTKKPSKGDSSPAEPSQPSVPVAVATDDSAPKPSQIVPAAESERTFSSRNWGRHVRHHTEVLSTPVEEESPAPVASLRPGRNTLGSRSKRRSRVTASVYEPSSSGFGEAEEDRGEEIQDSAEAFRRRIEALKNDMGEGWLRVFSQEAASHA